MIDFIDLRRPLIIPKSYFLEKSLFVYFSPHPICRWYAYLKDLRVFFQNKLFFYVFNSLHSDFRRSSKIIRNNNDLRVPHFYVREF